MRILGCSRVHANRVLYDLRGGKIRPVSISEQILTSLTSGAEKKTREIVAAIDGHPKAIDNELRKLVSAGEIVRVRWGVYALNKNIISILRTYAFPLKVPYPLDKGDMGVGGFRGLNMEITDFCV